jgi:hypothetical protein
LAGAVPIPKAPCAGIPAATLDKYFITAHRAVPGQVPAALVPMAHPSYSGRRWPWGQTQGGVNSQAAHSCPAVTQAAQPSTLLKPPLSALPCPGAGLCHISWTTPSSPSQGWSNPHPIGPVPPPPAPGGLPGCLQPSCCVTLGWPISISEPGSTVELLSTLMGRR